MTVLPSACLAAAQGGDPRVAVVFFVAVCAIIVVGVAYGLWADRKRTRELMMIAARLGFPFEKDPGLGALSGVDRMPLFSKGHSRRVRNLIRMSREGAEWRVFDYQYTTGSGKNRSTHGQTVACVSVPGRRLPDFTLTPENFLTRIGEMFGYEDIDFPEHPVFSKKFCLQGPRPDDVRQAFTPAVVSALEASDIGWRTEASGDTVVFYSLNLTVKPADLSDHLRRADRVVSLFLGLPGGAGGTA